MDSPISISIIFPANKTMELQMLAAYPISSPVIPSLITTTAYPTTLAYVSSGRSTTLYKSNETKNERKLYKTLKQKRTLFIKLNSLTKRVQLHHFNNFHIHKFHDFLLCTNTIKSHQLYPLLNFYQ